MVAVFATVPNRTEPKKKSVRFQTEKKKSVRFVFLSNRTEKNQIGLVRFQTEPKKEKSVRFVFLSNLTEEKQIGSVWFFVKPSAVPPGRMVYFFRIFLHFPRTCASG